MTGFILKIDGRRIIRFKYYTDAAPTTAAAFDGELSFKRRFVHARVSGQEFWTDDAPALDIIQENSSVFVEPGEIVIGTLRPHRNKEFLKQNV